MLQPELLIKKVVEILEAAGIEYMMTGSIVSSLQGEPRSTHDIDLVVALPTSAVDSLVEAFPSPDFYLSKDSILDAIEHQSMFNIINVSGGDKVDFWILTDEPFDRSRFSRKYVEEIAEIRIQVSSPEDTILAKLRWAQLSGGSERQFGDALRVYEVQFEQLDRSYLAAWAKALNVESLWNRLQAEAIII